MASQLGIPSCALNAGQACAVPVILCPTAQPMLFVPKSNAIAVMPINYALLVKRQNYED